MSARMTTVGLFDRLRAPIASLASRVVSMSKAVGVRFTAGPFNADYLLAARVYDDLIAAVGSRADRASVCVQRRMHQWPGPSRKSELHRWPPRPRGEQQNYALAY